MDILIKEREHTIIENFNSSDDYQIFNILAGDKKSNEEKKYLIDNCYERLDKMDTSLLIRLLQSVDYSFCTICHSFIKTKISKFNKRQVGELLYYNKYYHEISPIAKFLVENEWFKNEYKIFVLAYELEELLTAKYVAKDKTIDFGIYIISILRDSNTTPELFDMIMKNYLCILEKHNREFLDQFKSYGYEVMDQHLSENQELTSNLLIFDCEIMPFNSEIKVDYFEFYDSSHDLSGKNAFAYANAGKIRINVDAIKDIYSEYKNKIIATQIIFYIIGHEIDHIFCERYKSGEDKNPYTELKVYNSGISEALQNIMPREFYRQYHNCFAHEFQANISGIKSLYARYNYLKNISKEDKIEVNRLLSGVLVSSFCEVESPSKTGFFGPVEFTRDEFDKHKDNLPLYAYHSMLNKTAEISHELQELEDNLSELERLMLGYHNKYIGIIDLVARGKIKTDNIFENLPCLYEEHKEEIKDKFKPFIERSKNSKKMI
ncbi:MAG: hypothetical protein K2G03_07000 [Bacilli bacterium]|nr:hypothetical protein [Bacilli bacterium]